MFECPNFFWPVELYSYKVFFLFKDLVCPRCDSGFIEEVSEDSRYSSVLVRKLTFWFLKNCFTQIFFTLLSSLLQNSSTSSSSEESDSLFSEVCPYNKQRWTKNSPLCGLCLTFLPLWSLSELWQLLFMERSALLSHPPSSESDPDDGEQVSAGQSRPSPVLPGAAEAREPESPSQPEQERSPRSEQRPAVEGCVGMVHRNSDSV